MDRLYGWHLHLGRVDYERTLGWQHGLVRMREQGFARDTIITVEHPPVITVGKDGHKENFAGLETKPVFIERGGDVTYHGPGQLVVYFIFNLTRRGRDLHKLMDDIQQGIIRTLADLGITASKGTENTGVWVGEEKIASIGVAVKRWISFHGAAINLNTRLSDFGQIQPCGLNPGIMTSTEKLLGRQLDLAETATSLVAHYEAIFDTPFAPIDLETLAEDVESQSGGYEI
ncbi:MAG: lipoyl(octanoyl) transferase LipB [candidate division Zixibacteria bacterium]|nr:lipoyl(octanoyl) transferase LipB [candidate division Zixibacteria bacterium]